MSDEDRLRVRAVDARDGDFVETECPRCGEIVRDELERDE